MNALSLISGLQRRVFRRRIDCRLRDPSARSVPGRARLPGYGLTVEYPDERIWVGQMAEVFGDDCYGVHALPWEPTVIDAGANIGMFSLYLLWRRPLANVVAVEPDEENLDYLRRNLAPYSRAALKVVPAALGKHHGTTRLGGDTSDGRRTGVQGGMEVPVLTLPEVAPPQTIDLLKMDVEGAELDVLEGAAGILARVRRVVVEMHQYQGGNVPEPDAAVLLRAHGFDRFLLGSNREFPENASSSLPIHCCLLTAWRSRPGIS